jgi:acetyl esterase/lipase
VWPALAADDADAGVLKRCITMPSERLLGFDSAGQPIRLAASGIAPRRRIIRKDGKVIPAPPRKTTPIIRKGANGGLIFMQDVAGNERYSLGYKPPSKLASTQDALQIISPPGARVASPLLIPSRDATVFTSTASQGPLWGLLEYQKGEALRILFQQPGAWQAMAASPDGTRVLVQEIFGLYDRVLYILDRQSGLKTPLFLGQRPLAIRGAALSNAGKSAYVLLATATRSGVLVQADVYNARTQVILKTQWPLYSLAMSADGTAIAALENRNGTSVLHHISTADAAQHKQIALNGWAYDLYLSAKGTRFGVTREHPGIAAHVIESAVETSAIAPVDTDQCASVSLTTLEIGRAAPIAGLSAIPSLLLEPRTPSTQPRPLLIAFHGGPEGQWRQGSHLERAALASSLNAAILMPNIAGSTGYGLAYSAADDGAKRKIVVSEVESILKWAKADGRFDSERLAVMGASYGGYLALLAQTKFNDGLQGAISEVGISDLPRFLSETPITRRALRRAEYGDERSAKLAKALAALSPVTGARAITNPVFLAHGVNDARVPLNQSSEMAALLQSQGTPVRYRPIDGEGHVLRSTQTQLSLAREKLGFLKEILAREPAPQ